MCIRIDSYESEEAQKIVRSYLNGRFANTVFCLLSPNGKERLSRSHRSPQHVFGEDTAGALGKIASRYPGKGKAAEAAVPDFPNFHLGLNVASADQRVLVLVTGKAEEVNQVRKSLVAVSNDAEVIGRFHFDFETDAKSWNKALTESKEGAQIMIISPDTYGQTGKVMKSLPLDTNAGDLKKALLEANQNFVKTTKKKNYSTHVSEGRRQGVSWTMPMEFGEDRDGDGKIDPRQGGRGRR